MRSPFVVAESDVEGVRADGDTVLEKTTWDGSNGSEVLEQRLLRFAPGRCRPRRDDRRDELLYVVAGAATLALDDDTYPLEPDTGAYVRAGESWLVDNPGPGELHVVSVSVPGSEDAPARSVTVRFSERPERRADAKRSFRNIVDGDAGCRTATQFVGLVEPCRAPDHSHSYDELGYIVEGQGYAHVGGESIELGPGSCFRLPPEQVHCIENAGPAVMRILGVFHPSGDPASRTYDEAASTAKRRK